MVRFRLASWSISHSPVADPLAKMTLRLLVTFLVGGIVTVGPIDAQTPSPAETDSAAKVANRGSDTKPPDRARPCDPIVSVCDLLDQYAALTGFKIIRDNFVQGKVTTNDVSALPKEKAIEMIERSLFANHYYIVQVDAKTIQIVGPGQNPRTVGVPVVTKESEIPTGERIITYLFRFQHRPAVEMQQIMGRYVSPPQTYTSFLASSSSDTVVATERTSVIRALVKIAAQMDVAGGKLIPRPNVEPPARRVTCLLVRRSVFRVAASLRRGVRARSRLQLLFEGNGGEETVDHAGQTVCHLASVFHDEGKFLGIELEIVGVDDDMSESFQLVEGKL